MVMDGNLKRMSLEEEVGAREPGFLCHCIDFGRLILGQLPLLGRFQLFDLSSNVALFIYV